ncbi:MAG: COX15/CtaA family protein [Saprospiraceae bacterium]
MLRLLRCLDGLWWQADWLMNPGVMHINSLHLSLALLVFSYLLWTTFYAFGIRNSIIESASKWRSLNIWLLVLVCFQIILGGLMSGMHAALVYPTWPLMHDSFIPSLLFDSENWKLIHFTDYDKNPFIAALVQVFHRMTGYLVYIFGFGLASNC